MKGYIPKRYEEARLKDFPNGEFRESLWELVGTSNGLVLEGPNGVGKTHAMAAVAHAQWVEGFTHKPPVYVPAAMIHDLWTDEDTWRDQPWVITLKTSELLLVDDLGKENRTTDYRQDIASQRIGELLRYRVQHGVATYITTNISLDRLKETYGESIESLLHELADTWLVMSGKDRRR